MILATYRRMRQSVDQAGNRPTVPKRQSILVIDNYDSFTFNLVHYLIECGASVNVVRSDQISSSDARLFSADAFMISPGPGRPEQAGRSLELVDAIIASQKPLLGVCLGHQAIAIHFGGKVVHASRPVHGKTDIIDHDGSGLFVNLPPAFDAVRYHSLVVDPLTLPPELIVNAWSSDGSVQALRHHFLPVHGVQFHPESAATQHGHALLANFLELIA